MTTTKKRKPYAFNIPLEKIATMDLMSREDFTLFDSKKMPSIFFKYLSMQTTNQERKGQTEIPMNTAPQPRGGNQTKLRVTT